MSKCLEIVASDFCLLAFRWLEDFPEFLLRNATFCISNPESLCIQNDLVDTFSLNQRENRLRNSLLNIGILTLVS